MRPKRVIAGFFSPTGTTRKMVCYIAKKIADGLSLCVEEVDFTLPDVRNQALSFTKESMVIFGVPVYAGRVPNILLKYLQMIVGNGCLVVPVVLYGNRNFDDALIELRDILETAQCSAIGAGAFVGEHAFSKTLGTGRPDGGDYIASDRLAAGVLAKLAADDLVHPVIVPGRSPSPGYYQPRDRQGNAIDIRKVKPLVNERCNNCGICAAICPMGSISNKNYGQYQGICIKCGACIKGCPQEARFYDDPGYLYHKEELEKEYSRRSESVVWI